jgi:hypothetical protein
MKKRQFAHVLIALLSNLFLFQWTYPNGGYGVIAVMLLAPLFNIGQLLIYVILVALLRRKKIADWPELVIPAIVSISLIVVMLVLAGTVYKGGGC